MRQKHKKISCLDNVQKKKKERKKRKEKENRVSQCKEIR